MDDTIRHEIDRTRARRHWLRGPELCRAAGITYRQLDYWARTGVFEPAVAAAVGSGTQRRYAPHQAHVASVLGALAAMGAQRAALAAAATYLELEPLEEWAGLLLIWPDGEIAHVRPNDRIGAAGFRAAWVVNLEICRADTEQRDPRMAAAS